MKRIHTFMKRGGNMLVLGAFLTLFLQGCATNVDVKCGPGSAEGVTQITVGLCNPFPVSGNYTGSANGFWNDATNTTYTGSNNCASGKKCATPAGRCANGVACKSRFNNTTSMVCKCDCKP